MKREISITADGSKTLFIPDLDEHYHSLHGALQEAQHIFIQNGLAKTTNDYLTIFEMGFGTGLNAFLSYFFTEKRNQIIHYLTLEKYPVSPEEVALLDYSKFANDSSAETIFQRLHECDWGIPQYISEHFVLQKMQQDIKEMEFEKESFDVVFYDAFGPRVQEDLWSLAIFQKLFSAMAKGGFLVTYCAKGQVKRDLKTAGFEVESLAGPPGKREMTRAWKR